MRCIKAEDRAVFREGTREWRIGGVFCDAGINGSYLRRTLAFEPYDGFCATAMPKPCPTGTTYAGFAEVFEANGVTLRLEEREGRLLPSMASVRGGEEVTGFVTVFSGIPVTEDAWVEFPSNLPWERFRVSELKPLEPVSMWFAGTALHLFDGVRHVALCYRKRPKNSLAAHGWGRTDC